MKTLRKRMLAIVCCMVLCLNSFSGVGTVAKASERQAGAGTISIADTTLGFRWGTGYFNISYLSTVMDYKSNGANFLTPEFVDEYISFGGGMTYADLMDGMFTFYIATGNILQLNYVDRVNDFQPGWHFTIEQGAPLPYVNTAGSTAYMTLDKEYQFTFGEGKNGYDFLLTIEGYRTTTFSLEHGKLFGNGLDVGTQFYFNDSNVTGWDHAYYVDIHNDASYAEYIDFNGAAYETVAEKGLKMRYILDGTSTKCLQIENWGDFRADSDVSDGKDDTIKEGGQIIFKKGLPIYYTGKDGYNYKATLDATYVYVCQGSNSGNSQTFIGAKCEETSSNTFGLLTSLDKNNVTAAGVAEDYINFNYKTATGSPLTTTEIYYDVLVQRITTDYIDFSGCSVDLKAIGARLLYIPHANVLQFQLGDKTAYRAGDTILLKKGMPIVWMPAGQNTYSCVMLDDDYRITFKENEGGALTLDCTVGGTFGLAGTMGGRGEEGIYYHNVHLAGNVFAADETFYGNPDGDTIAGVTQGKFYDQATLLKKYISVPGKTGDELIADGWYLCRYNVSAYSGLRIYYPTTSGYLKDGNEIIFRKGFPITYKTSDGSIKTITLDRDYGFVYKAGTATFAYDPTIYVEEEATRPTTFSLPDRTLSGLKSEDKWTATVAIEDAPFPYEGDVVKEIDAEYIDFTNCANEEAVKADTKLVFALKGRYDQTIQLELGDNAVNALQEGDRILLKKGLVIVYSETDEQAVATLDDLYAISVTGKSENRITLDLGLTGSFSLSKDTFYFSTSEKYANIRYVDGNLSDARSFESAMGGRVMRDYFAVSSKNYDSLKNQEYKLWNFYVDALKGLRFSCATYDLENGDYVVFKKGLPIVYTTNKGKERTVYLDKDYVFQNNGGTAFVYQNGMNAEDVSFEELEDTGILDDINADGNVNAKDLLRLKKYLGNKETPVNPDKVDVNLNGECDDSDELALKEVLVDAYDWGHEAEEFVDFLVDVEEGRDIVVLQLTDTQIMDSSQMRRADILSSTQQTYYAPDMTDERCYDHLRETIEAVNPDLIIMTGDLVYGQFDDSGERFLELVEFMESCKIPWAPIFGNHDNESKKGVDWQCAQFEAAEYCLFEQRTLTGNGNYTVGVRQGGTLKRVFFMMDSNGIGSPSDESLANGHTSVTPGFGLDQVDWFITTGKNIARAQAGIKLSFAYHIQSVPFTTAFQKYTATGDGSLIDIDNLEGKTEGDFGYTESRVRGSWDDDFWILDKMKGLGTDSIFVGHEHCNSASVVYEGVRFQFGQKSTEYDMLNYRKADGSVIMAECYSAGTPLLGGTVMKLSEADGNIDEAYIYYCEE